jgi:hypothetical protein
MTSIIVSVCSQRTVASQQIENTESPISLFNLYRPTLPVGQVGSDDVTGPTTEPPIQQLSSTVSMNFRL